MAVWAEDKLSNNLTKSDIGTSREAFAGGVRNRRLAGSARRLKDEDPMPTFPGSQPGSGPGRPRPVPSPPGVLLLFDVDATLLLTGGAGMRAMIRAAAELFGERLVWEGIEPSGGLDPLLLAEAAARSGVDLDDAGREAFRQRYIELLAGELRRSAATVRALPGVQEVIRHLLAEPRAVLGLVTGNYPQTAALKLAAVGLDREWFKVAAFGDEGPSRTALVRLAIARYAALDGGARPLRRVIVIGDTPRDVECALQNGAVAFSVATGKYGIEALRAAGAHVAVADLSDPGPLLALLDGGGERAP
jgi:phosphoglycolate phosphatase-like HAD superfamily hydrolase